MHRFHHSQLITPENSIPEDDAWHLSDATIELSKEESHHAIKVLRLKAGDSLSLFDGQGAFAQGVIDRAGSRVIVKLGQIRRVPPPLPRIDVAVAIPKGSRADAMIEQLSQLGCDCVIPLRTRRSIVDPRDSKLDRFARAAIESAKQCGRAHVMRIETPMDFGEKIWRMNHDVRLIALPEEAANALHDDRIRKAKSLLILIGPEGGWTEDEIEAARAAGCESWTLGPHIMRIETAATTAVGIVRYLANVQG